MVRGRRDGLEYGWRSEVFHLQNARAQRFVHPHDSFAASPVFSRYSKSLQ